VEPLGDFLLDPGTVSVLGDYRGIPALKQWNAPVVGDTERDAMAETTMGGQR
jgi:hypothetical protein